MKKKNELEDNESSLTVRLDSKRTREEEIQTQPTRCTGKKNKKRTFECAGRFSDFFINKMKEAKFRGKKTDCLPLVLRYIIFIPLII